MHIHIRELFICTLLCRYSRNKWREFYSYTFCIVLTKSVGTHEKQYWRGWYCDFLLQFYLNMRVYMQHRHTIWIKVDANYEAEVSLIPTFDYILLNILNKITSNLHTHTHTDTTLTSYSTFSKQKDQKEGWWCPLLPPLSPHTHTHMSFVHFTYILIASNFWEI